MNFSPKICFVLFLLYTVHYKSCMFSIIVVSAFSGTPCKYTYTYIIIICSCQSLLSSFLTSHDFLHFIDEIYLPLRRRYDDVNIIVNLHNPLYEVTYTHESILYQISMNSLRVKNNFIM